MVSPLLDIPDKDEPKRFVLQQHFRGRSVHGDLRFDVGDHLIGLTLDDPGAVGKPSKLSNVPGMNGKKILIQVKARQPKVWLDLEGEIDPGEIGATRFKPGKFKIIDKGNYEMGAQKVQLFEVFLKGKKFNGRFIARLLPRDPGFERAGKTAMVRFFWKPKDQTPLVLSKRSINKRFVPPAGRSALPEEIRKQIPQALRWWETSLQGDKALAKIDEARKLLVKKKLINDTEDQSRMAQAKFVLQKSSFKGPTVIRGQPKAFFNLRFDKGFFFDMDRNIIFDDQLAGTLIKETPQQTKERFPFYGDVPGLNQNKKENLKIFNPNKELRARVWREDEGNVDIIEDTPGFKSFNFKGKNLKGFYTARMSAENQFIISKGKLPKASKKLNDEQLNKLNHLLETSELSLNEIAYEVGCSRSSVIYHRSKLSLDI